MKRLTVVGKPTDKDLASLLEEEAPAIVQAEFKTTVDETEWHG